MGRAGAATTLCGRRFFWPRARGRGNDHLAARRPVGRAVPTTVVWAGGPAHPDRRRRHLAARRPVGRAVPTTVVRAGGSVHPDRRSCHSAACRPVGRAGAAITLCGRRGAGSRPGEWRTGPTGPGPMCSGTTMRSVSSHRPLAYGRGVDSDAACAGPRGPGPADDPDGVSHGQRAAVAGALSSPMAYSGSPAGAGY